MIFNKHLELIDKHALLGGSKYHWIDYDDDHVRDYYIHSMAAERGTRLHAFAKECIELGQKLPRSKKTLNMFVNDAIGYGMTPEQPLYFNEYCFGTADAISFSDKLLRIHDLKTGISTCSMKQLYIYAAIFCQEYNKNPFDIDTELRIYQKDQVFIENGDPEFINHIINTVKHHTTIIRKTKF